MKYTITTYDTNGKEVLSRNYQSVEGATNYQEQVESILEDSAQYLEEQTVDYKEEPKSEAQADEDEDNYIYGENGEHDCMVNWTDSAGNVDDDGVCTTCGKTDLI